MCSLGPRLCPAVWRLRRRRRLLIEKPPAKRGAYPRKVRRTILGLIAAALLAGGLLLTFTAEAETDGRVWGGILLRSGAVLGAVWLVYPKARRVSPPMWAAITTVIVVLAVRPRLIMWGLVLGVAAAIAIGLGRSRSSR